MKNCKKVLVCIVFCLSLIMGGKTVQASWVQNKDVKLWTETFGSSQDPAVLLIIGAGAVSSFYPDMFCDGLAEQGYFVIRYDQRDYGKSSHFPQVTPLDFGDLEKLKSSLPYCIEDLVEDALTILDHYHINQAAIIGHSMGGTIAQLLSVLHPERVSKIISISVGPASPNAAIEPIPEETMQILLANQPVGDLAKDREDWMNSFRLLNGNMPFDEAIAEDYLQEIYARTPKPGVAWNHIGIQSFLPDLDESFKKSSIPTLLLHGEDDPIQPVSYISATQTLIPKAQTKTFPHYGHMFFNQDCWKTVLETCSRFLNS